MGFTAVSLAPEVQDVIPSELVRKSPYLTHSIFNSYVLLMSWLFIFKLFSSKKGLGSITVVLFSVGSTLSMSYLGTFIGFNQRISPCATAWFPWDLVRWNWMQQLRWCLLHGLPLRTSTLLPPPSKLLVTRFKFFLFLKRNQPPKSIFFSSNWTIFLLQEMFKNLGEMLCTITGFDSFSLQPNAGAAGEYAGLMVIRAYHMVGRVNLWENLEL